MMQKGQSGSPVRADAPENGRLIEAVVKWFNLAKGFGFVTPTDGTPDAFLPMAIVRRAGLHDLEPGAYLRCTVGPGAKGPLVYAIHAVAQPTSAVRPAAPRQVPRPPAAPVVPPPNDLAPVVPPPNDLAPVVPQSNHPAPTRVMPRPSRPIPPPLELGDYIGKTVEATVKWYEDGKGFGFAALDGGRQDVFIHMTALRRSGVSRIVEGQRVRVSVIEGRKGLEAEYIDLI